jgi:hypothetical protein
LTTFEYLSVFISIVIGLAIVRVLGGVAEILNRREVRPYWVHSTWVAYFVVWLPYFWWFTFDWRLEETWTFPLFMFVVTFAMLAYLCVIVLVPTRRPDLENLEDYFYRARPRFFAIWALVMVTDVIDTFLKPGNLADVGPTYLPIMAIIILGHIVGALTENRRFHEIWVIATVVLTLTFALGVWADVFSRN